MNIETILNRRNIAIVVLAFISLIALNMSIYTVEEGHIAVVKNWGKAQSQVGPGIHMKVPFMQSLQIIEVRTRKNEEKMPTSTSEQMPVTAIVSVNWTVNKVNAIDLFKQYGGLDQFEARILDPRFKSATKDSIPKFKAEQLIQDRAQAIALIEENLKKEMKDFPVTVDNVQIENIILPGKYIESIQIKQTEKNLAEAEKHKLDRQNLTAQQKVNTANAEGEAIERLAAAEAEKIRLKGDADAHAIEARGLAEAKAITAKAKALKQNPSIIKLTEVENWNGQLPTMVPPSGGMLMNFDSK